MAAPGIPQSVTLQTANGQNYLSWDIVSSATSYDVQRSIDGVTYASVSTPTLNEFLDDAYDATGNPTGVVIGTQYWYKVCATNTDGSSSYSDAQSCVPVPTGEMSLGQIRLNAQQTADRVNSNFVTKTEWNTNINLAQMELYDLLVTAYDDYFLADPVTVTFDGSSNTIPLPNGTNYDHAPAFYKLMGVDLAVSNANNAWVTLDKFNFADRNRFVYPNTASTMYGVFNLRYRPMGSNIIFEPTPSGNQIVRLWYVPRLLLLLKDTDISSTSVSGWIRYVIVRAAKYALDKEESDTSKLDAELVFLKERIEGSADNRDAGRPDTISDTRSNSGGNGYGWNGPIGGF